MEKFGKRLKNTLMWKGMEQKELAIQINVAKSTVSEWISGKSFPTLKTFYRLCLVLGETPNYFLGFKEY